MPFFLGPCLLIAALAGAAGSVSQGIWPSWWLQILSLAVLCALLFGREQARPQLREGILITFVYGLTYFGIGVGWLYISMHRYGGMVAPLAGLGVFLMAALLASFSALAAGAALFVGGTPSHYHFGRSPASGILLFAGFWGFAEWTRSWIFTGFPWAALGYSQLDGPLADAAPVVGVYGLGLLVMMCAGGLSLLVMQARRRQFAFSGLACIILAWVCSFAFSHLDFTTSSGKSFTVRLVQGNVPQDMKFDADRVIKTMRMYIEQVRTSKASLTVLPETAWTTLLDRTPPEIMAELTGAIRESGTRLAMGLPVMENGQIFNSVVMLEDTGKFSFRYDKRHLVPFGEFVPPGFRWFVDQMHIPLGDFGRGGPAQALLRHENQSIAFNICYEDLFGEALADQVRRGALVLLNVSNIAWFGDSHALEQHLSIARMRAMELGRPMLRATNTGVTAVIQSTGAVQARLPSGVQGNLDAEVLSTQGLTPFARFGNSLFLLGAATLLIVGAIMAFSVKRSSGQRQGVRRV